MAFLLFIIVEKAQAFLLQTSCEAAFYILQGITNGTSAVDKKTKLKGGIVYFIFLNKNALRETQMSSLGEQVREGFKKKNH